MDTGGQHQMVVKNTYPSGAQEWFCPACGRRFLMQWPPNYKRVILEEGDDMVIHSGGDGGLVMGPVEVIPAQPPPVDDLDDPRLAPYIDWLQNKPL